MTGTWSVGWSQQIVDSFRSLGIDAVADHPDMRDPFALLLHRIENPGSLYVTTLTDTVYHPEVSKLLKDLSGLLPPGPWKHICLRADVNEFFNCCIQDHKFCGTFQDMLQLCTAPEYIPGLTVSRYEVPPHCADTPELLALFLMTLKEIFDTVTE